MLNLPQESKFYDPKYFSIYIIPWSISLGAEYNSEYNNNADK